MKMLSTTLLYGYIHIDGMIQASFSLIVDDPNGKTAYGPFKVYDILAKDQVRFNADSYAYYASQDLWTSFCGH